MFCLLMVNTMLISHGTNARNRFQFKNKNIFVSVTMYLTIDMLKQNTDDNIKNIDMFKLLFFFNSSIILNPFEFTHNSLFTGIPVTFHPSY